MFVCTYCGHLFEIPKKYVEKHGLEFGGFETFEGCPECGGHFATAFKCDCCHQYIVDDYIKTDDGNRYCGNCYIKAELGDED